MINRLIFTAGFCLITYCSAAQSETPLAYVQRVKKQALT